MLARKKDDIKGCKNEKADQEGREEERKRERESQQREGEEEEAAATKAGRDEERSRGANKRVRRKEKQQEMTEEQRKKKRKRRETSEKAEASQTSPSFDAGFIVYHYECTCASASSALLRDIHWARTTTDYTGTVPDHAVFTPFAQSRRMFFLNLPVLVLGSSATTSTSRGIMNLLMSLLVRAQPIKSAPWSCLPGLTVTYALGRSPQCVSGTATTPASRTSGWVTSMDSRATEEMFSPPGWIVSAGIPEKPRRMGGEGIEVWAPYR